MWSFPKRARAHFPWTVWISENRTNFLTPFIVYNQIHRLIFFEHTGITQSRPKRRRTVGPTEHEAPEDKRRQLMDKMKPHYPKGVMFQLMIPAAFRRQEICQVTGHHDLNVSNEVDISTSAPPPATMRKLTNQYVGRVREPTPENFVESLPKLNDEDIKYICKRTEGQPSSQEWKDHRVGRITASMVH